MNSSATPDRRSPRRFVPGSRLTVVLLVISTAYFSALIRGAPAPLARDRAARQDGWLQRQSFNLVSHMSVAVTTRSGGWKSAVRKKAQEMMRGQPGIIGEATLVKAERALRQERMKERDILVAWLRAGAPRRDYENDRQRVRSILVNRCGRCHEGSTSMLTYDDWKKYLRVE